MYIVHSGLQLTSVLLCKSMSVCHRLLYVCSGLFSSLDPKMRNTVLDELTYKLSINQSGELGR